MEDKCFYIDKNIRIEKLDDRCLELKVFEPCKSRKTGKETNKWKFYGYYGTVKAALLAALKLDLFKAIDSKTSVEQLVDRIGKAEKTILKAIDNKGVPEL